MWLVNLAAMKSITDVSMQEERQAQEQGQEWQSTSGTRQLWKDDDLFRRTSLATNTHDHIAHVLLRIQSCKRCCWSLSARKLDTVVARAHRHDRVERKLLAGTCSSILSFHFHCIADAYCTFRNVGALVCVHNSHLSSAISTIGKRMRLESGCGAMTSFVRDDQQQCDR